MEENGVNHQTDNPTPSSETQDINTALTHIEGLEIDKRSELVSKSLNLTTISDALTIDINGGEYFEFLNSSIEKILFAFSL